MLNTYVPVKKKVVRANHMPYMTKVLRKAIMKRSYLQKKYYKSKSLEDRYAFKRQRNYCNRMYKREKRNYSNNLNLNKIQITKHFGKRLNHFCQIKGIFINILP